MKPAVLLAEFIGTFALIFVGVLAIVHGGGNLTSIALAHGLAIAVMVSATAAISGGHLNPAVTLGLMIGGKVRPALAAGYLLAQCAGALAAAAILLPVVGPDGLAAGTPAPGAHGTPPQTYSLGVVILVEAVLTFFLAFVVYGTAVDPRAPKVGGLFIGLTVALDICAGGPITGTAMNPARHLGPALLSGDSGHLALIWVYWLGPILGGLAAGLIYPRCLQAKAD